MKLLFVLFLKAFVASAIQCPGGWEPHALSCYSFVTSAREHWTIASYSCSLHGANLVEINSATENDFLIKHLTAMGVNADFWIGLTDDSLESHWEWLPAGATPGYTAWAPGQPDNGHNEDCALLSHSRNYLWNDDQCDNSHYFICEKEAEIGNSIIIG